MGEGSMKRTMQVTLALLVSVSVGSIFSGLASARERVANPETIFRHGMGWTERHGNNKGVLQLNPAGGALIHWNGITYRGHWQKIDEYHVETTWENGGPPGSIWSLRATGDATVPY